MRVMFFGGSGQVATLVLPFMKEWVEPHVFDVKEPRVADVPYHPGDVTDPKAIGAALAGMDAAVYMAMVPEAVLNDIGLSYDINVKGLHLVLKAAQEAGIRRVVYCSTGSVYDGVLRNHRTLTDEIEPDARTIYGFTKRMGERVCEWFCRHHEMTVPALRLWRPMDRSKWEAVRREKPDHPWAYASTLDRDVASAIRAALELPIEGYQAMTISGDWSERRLDLSRARKILRWQPTPWPPVSTGAGAD